MSNAPTITYILDGVGLFGALVGGAVAARSKYSDLNSKQAAQLIDTLTKRVDEMDKTITDLTSQLGKYRQDNSALVGQLQAYKELALVSPEIITKLTSTLDNVLEVLTRMKPNE